MISENVSEWMGLPVKAYDFANGVNDYETCLYRFAVDWDADYTVLQALDKFLANPEVEKVPGIVIGLFAPESEGDSSAIVAKLVEAKDRLKSLQGIFMNDIIQEEQEMSWIENCDMSPLLKAYPNLKHFRVRGGKDLALGTLDSDSLLSLTVETGGLPREIVESIRMSKLPNLQHLELWLGTDEYGGSTTVDDVKSLLGSWHFPSVKSLGLRNCEFGDELAKLVASHPVVAQLDVLDLSLGTVGDEGGKALFASEHIEGLKKLDLHFHYMTDAVSKQFEGLGIAVDVSDRQEEDDWDGVAHRYVAVGE